jgi:hypothetical protein
VAPEQVLVSASLTGTTLPYLAMLRSLSRIPWRTITTNSVPFWTFFPVRPAAASLAAYLDRKGYDEIDIMLFSHGVESRGMAGAASWKQLADRAKIHGRLLGVHPDQFPADFAVFARYTKALRSLPSTSRPWVPMSIEAAVVGLTTAEGVTVKTMNAER